MKILLTAIGKRVQLIKHLQTYFEIIGVDTSELIAARTYVNEFVQVPRCEEIHYVESLLKVCKEHKIDAIIPLYEREFESLAKQRKNFENAGTKLILSNEKLIAICNDKYLTHQFFDKWGIKSPKILNQVGEDRIDYPVIVKPRDGMGSQNVFIARNQKELNFFRQYVSHSIIEEYIQGTEYTLDVLCDFEGNPIYIVPRERLEVRGGEVSKSKVVRDEKMIEATYELLKKLNQNKEDGIGIIGPLTVQCFKTTKKEYVFLEINPRFGGGVPLAFAAGADYAQVLYKLLKGQRLSYQNQYEECIMLRFDEAIFI